MSDVLNRFLAFTAYDTQSDYDAECYPSTESQLAFGKILAAACNEIGLTDVRIDRYGYVTAVLPSNLDYAVPTIGFLAHMDTSGDAPGSPVNPRVVRNYDGGVVTLNENTVLSPEQFPHLKNYIGQDLVVTDGHTLLGADDKAGIAEILTAMEYLIKHPEIPHGRVLIAFTPDEEVGRGVNHFDTAQFGADFAFTIDGSEVGELEIETFNAARAVFNIQGVSVHPGYALHTMRNASLVAAEMIAAFPANETPAETQDREGFYHLTDVSGSVSSAAFSYLLRDFDSAAFDKRKQFVRALAERFNQQYGAGTVDLQIKEEYRNMAEILQTCPDIAELAARAMREVGITPLVRPVRGGTDGARLSFMGLPCPNLFTGGHNFHGPYEYIPVPAMEAAVQVIIHICKINAERKEQ